MKPEVFSERDSADSMRAAAGRLDVPLDLVKECKRRGSPAFRGSRVYLRPLAEMIAANEEPDSIMFPIPTSLESNSKTVKEFRELLRVAIRCGFLPASEIFEILLQQVIDHLCTASPAATSAHPKREIKTFDKLTRAIHEGFGMATWCLDDDATDEYLRRSAAALDRARKKLFQSYAVRRDRK